ncbi:hypothetical protein SK128_012103, partial [Halocaridina rubra]
DVIAVAEHMVNATRFHWTAGRFKNNGTYYGNNAISSCVRLEYSFRNIRRIALTLALTSRDKQTRAFISRFNCEDLVTQ